MELFGRTKNADTTLLFTWVQLSSCLAAALGTKGGVGGRGGAELRYPSLDSELPITGREGQKIKSGIISV